MSTHSSNSPNLTPLVSRGRTAETRGTSPSLQMRASQVLRNSITPLFFVAAVTLTAIGCSSPATYPDGDLLPLDRLEPSAPSGPGASGSSQPEHQPSADQKVSPLDEELLEILAQSLWIRSVPVPSQEKPPYRWVYPALEDSLEEATVRQALLGQLNSPKPIVAANAAIGLVRLGDSSAVDYVAEAAGNRKLDVQLRCSAAEMLGHTPDGIEMLRSLLDDEVSQSRGRYSPACHAEMVRALGRHVQPADEPRLADALSGPDDEVKLAALDVWQRSADGVLPEQALELQNHSNPAIRAKLLTALASNPSTGTLEHLTSALNDPELSVRTSAIEALGTLGDEHAVPTLESLLIDGVEGEKIAAVGALAKLGEAEAVRGAAHDKSWRIRLAVANALPDLPDAPDRSLAGKLLDDPSGEVQYQAVDAIQKWPPAIAEPLLLDALATCAFRSQKLAAEALARSWPEGRPLLDAFPFGQSADKRELALAKIRAACTERQKPLESPEIEREIVFSPARLAPVVKVLQDLQAAQVDTQEYSQAAATLREIGPTVVEMLEYLVDRRGVVLPDRVFELLATEMPDFAVVEYFRESNVQARRRAARQLAESSVRRPPCPLMIRRLADLEIAETDAVVWQYLLTALAERNDAQTFRLVYAAMGHDSAGIRQKACEHLKQNPHPRHVNVLTAALNDASPLVVCAAVEALGECGGKVDPQSILPLLSDRSETVQVTAAEAIAHLGMKEGPAALERLAYSRDEQTRLRVAQVMGELALPEFAPSLIRLLDDRHGIRLAALNSLPKVAVCKEAEAENLRESDQIRAWRLWASRSNANPR